MTSTTIDFARVAQGRALDTLRQSQDAVVDAVGQWAKAVEGAANDLPAIPVLKGLPSVDELVKWNFDFAGEILASQREFTQKLIAAAAPAIKTTPVDLPVA